MPVPSTAHLSGIPLFASLTAEERNLVAPLCRVEAYEKGATVFAEGEPAHDLCFLILGRVKIVKAAQGRDLILGLFGPGEPIGVFAALERRPFPATAVAQEASSVLRVPERTFFARIGDRPEIARSLLHGLMLRQLELTRRIADLTGNVEFRMARLFITLAEKAGVRDGDGVDIPIALSRQEIADLTATTPETAIRVMSRWGKKKLVVTRRDGFSIPKLAALKGVAAG